LGKGRGEVSDRRGKGKRILTEEEKLQRMLLGENLSKGRTPGVLQYTTMNEREAYLLLGKF